MPITVPRPNISELLDVAVDQRKELLNTTIEILERPANIWYSQNDSWLYKSSMKISRICKKLRSNSVIEFIRIILALAACAIIAIEVNYIGEATSFGMELFEIITNSFVMIDALLRIISIPIFIRIETAFEREVNTRDVVYKSGLGEVIISAICFVLRNTLAGVWFQLLRAIVLASGFLDYFPYIQVLVTGIKNGLKSLSFTILLLFLVIMSYASLCHVIFEENDPFRFGTVALSAFTLFSMTTFNGWTTAYYVNFSGCDAYPSEYFSTPIQGDGRVVTKFGVFYQPDCSNPVSQEIASSAIFFSFAFISGYFILSMSLAAVAIGFKEKLAELNNLALDEEEGNDHVRKSNEVIMNNSKVAKMLGNNFKAAHIKKMLQVIWGESKSAYDQNENSMTWKKINDWMDFKDYVSSLVARRSYDYFMSSMLLGVAVLEIYESSVDERNIVGYSFHIIFQVIFTFDIFLKFIGSLQYGWKMYIRRPWVLFDLVVTSLSWIPLFASHVPEFQILSFLRVLRLLRILRNLSFIKDLGVILNAISGSFFSVIYLLFLLVQLLFFYACAATILFKNADPFRFRELGLSIRTLIQVMTTDDWSNIARVSMIGCRYYGYNTGLPKYDDLCIFDPLDSSLDGLGLGLGWWSPLFFVSFIILSSVVVMSLLVGVIITSMSLLREDLNDENAIWEKVNDIKERYELNKKSINLLLELFEHMDQENGSNGALTYQEIKPIMDIVAMPETNKFEFFMKVDTDSSGKIDFGEFCEFIILIGIQHGNSSKESSSRHRHHKSHKSRRMPQLSRGASSGDLVMSSDHVVTIESESGVIAKDRRQIDNDRHSLEEYNFISAHTKRKSIANIKLGDIIEGDFENLSTKVPTQPKALPSASEIKTSMVTEIIDVEESDDVDVEELKLDTRRVVKSYVRMF